MPLVSLVEWNVSLGSADVSWGGVRAIRTAAKETTTDLVSVTGAWTMVWGLMRAVFYLEAGCGSGSPRMIQAPG